MATCMNFKSSTECFIDAGFRVARCFSSRGKGGGPKTPQVVNVKKDARP